MLVKKVMDIIDIDMTVAVEFVIVVISITAAGRESIDALRRSLAVSAEDELMRLI